MIIEGLNKNIGPDIQLNSKKQKNIYMTKYKSKALFYFIFSNALKKDRTNRIHAKGIPAESSSPAARCRTQNFPQNNAAETFKIAKLRKKYSCRTQTRNLQADSFNSDKNSQIARKEDKPLKSFIFD